MRASPAENMVNIANQLATIILVFALLDIAIVFLAILQIGAGIDTPHIPFWDVQIALILNLLN